MARSLPPVAKDALILVGTFVVVLGGLYLYTGLWPPAVIVESGSMMHREDEVVVVPLLRSYGRVGTIDPGDLVFVKKVNGKDDVETWAMGGDVYYGKSGDVIVYYKLGNRKTTPIIHRAIAYVDVVEQSGRTYYDVKWQPGATCPGGSTRTKADTCRFGENGVSLPAAGVANYQPRRSGFITKGDNPVTNSRADQQSGLSDIVQPEWIEGKARSEVPWLGLIKLAISPDYNEPQCATSRSGFLLFEASKSSACRGWIGFGKAYAPQDLWVMLILTLGLLIGGPIAFDAARAHWQRTRGGGGAAPAVESTSTAPPPAEPPSGAPPDREP
ncbi:MAG TPA: S26 family signal peptidase [Candidatus Thermoplasmatota archaeon]|nr:S26 family signal peptidase [Candidatus Thermoplasmatota archaeon]